MPSSQPSVRPSRQPSGQPSTVPSLIPTGQPSSQPSILPTIQPSVSPSMQPSGTPTSQPTTAPTLVSVNIVKIARIVHSLSQTAVGLRVRFTTSPLFSGVLYCDAIHGAVTNEYPSVFSGTSVAYQPQARDVNITVNGLVAVRSYTVVCGVRSSNGMISTAAEIADTAFAIVTPCCRTITVSSFPSYLLADSSYYLSSINAGKNVVKWRLSALPDNDIIVKFNVVGASSSGTEYALTASNVSIIPEVWSLRNNSSMNIEVAIITKYLREDQASVLLISPVISGSDVSIYSLSSAAVLVNLIRTVDEPPLPTLLFARLSDEGNGLYMRFDSATNRGDVSDTDWKCSSLWAFPHSNSSKCNWLNATTVFAVFGPTDIGPSIGSPVTLLADRIAAQCVSSASVCAGYHKMPQTKVSAEAPWHPVEPVVVLTAPSRVAGCVAQVILNAAGSTGSAGRPWTSVSWAVYDSSGISLVEPTEYLRTRYSSSNSIKTLIELPTSILFGGTYFVTLSLTNGLGKTSTTTTSFFFGASSAVPMVVIGGPVSHVLAASSPLTLHASVTMPPCGATTRLSLQWSVYDVTSTQSLTNIGQPLSQIVSTSKTPSIFSLAGYQLTAGRTYSVHFIATNTVNNTDNRTVTYNASSSVTVIVSSGSLIAVVKGSSLRYISQSTTLDATSSYDEDSIATVLDYRWTCVYGSGLTFGASCDDAVGLLGNSSTSAIYVVTYDRLSADIVYTFVVTVAAHNAPTRTSSSAAVQIVKLVTHTDVAVQVAAKSMVLNYGTSQTIDANVKCDSDVVVAWEAWIDGRLQTIQNGTLSSRYWKASDVAGGINFPLMISNVDLPGGAQVDLRLSLYQSIDDSSTTSESLRYSLPVHYPWSIGIGHMTSRNQPLAMMLQLVALVQVTVKVNVPPQSGVLVVSPSKGFALETEFVAITSSWQDDPNDFPFTFDYRYTVDRGETFLFAQAQSSFSTAAMHLPVGMQSFDFRIVIAVQVYDLYNAKASRETEVTVTTNSDPSSVDFADILNALLQDAIALENANMQVSVLNAVSATMNFVNCSRTSPAYCESLGRQPCMYTAQTCSSCLVNFTGIVGDSNGRCRSPFEGPGGALGQPCTTGNDCQFGECSAQGLCAAPVKQCPLDGDGIECGGSYRGDCEYSIAGRKVHASSCTIVDTSCRTKCVCRDGFGGASCQYSTEQLLMRSAVRAQMCQSLSDATGYSDITSSSLTSISSALLSVYDQNEVVTSYGRDTCRGSLITILNSSTDSTGTSLFDMTSPDTAAAFVDVLSEFFDHGNSSFLNNATSKFVNAALSGMTDGQTDMILTSENYNIRLSRALVSDVANSTQTVPLTVEEAVYGKEPTGVEISGAGSAFNDGSGYVSMSVGAFSSMPYESDDADLLVTSMLRIESRTRPGSIPTDNSRRNLLSTRPVAYYLSFPFVQRQNLYSVTVPSEDINGTAILIRNETLPECSQYTEGSGSQTCSDCVVSTFSNDSVTFACYNMSQLSASSMTSDVRRKLFVDDDYYNTPSSEQGWEGTVYQTAALTVAVVTVFANVMSFNPFNINIEQAKGIIAFIGTMIVFSVGGLYFFHRWDRHDKEHLLANRQKKLVGKAMFARSQHFDIKEENTAEHVMHRFKVMIRRSLPIAIEEISQMSFLKRYFVHPFLHHHEYFMPAGKASLTETRSLRWTSFCFSIFSAMFLDTLFFSVFYADDGTCESYLDATTCLAEDNAVYASTKCLWNEETGCSLNAPPDNKIFSIIVSCVTMLIAVPLCFVFDYALNEVCAKDPDWGEWKFCRRSDPAVGKYGHAVGDNHAMLTMRSVVDDMIDVAAQIEPVLDVLQKITKWLQPLLELDKADVLTEMRAILVKAQPYFDYPLAQFKRAHVWEVTRRRLPLSQIRLFLHRVLVFLGLKSSKEKITSHVLHSVKLNMLQRSIVKAREQASAIVEAITGEAEEGDEKEEDVKEEEKELATGAVFAVALGSLEKSPQVLDEKEGDDEMPIWDQDDGIDCNQDLLQFFFLEQLPALQRYALKRQCFMHDFVLPEKIHYGYWLAGWFVIVGTMLFFVYWAFAWCVLSGNAAFKGWRNTLLANYMQDIFLMQVMKVYVIHISTQGAIIPRLHVMQTTLENLALTVYLQLEKTLQGMEAVEDLVPIVVAPQLQDSALVQHLSPVCRAARSPALRYLPAALLLQRVGDLDIHNCRKPPYSRPIGLLTVLMFALPLITQSTFGDGLADTVFETIFNFILTSAYAVIVFLFLNYMVHTIIAICVFAFLWMIYSFVQHYRHSHLEVRLVIQRLSHNMHILEIAATMGHNVAIREATGFLGFLLITVPSRIATQFEARRTRLALHEKIWTNMNLVDQTNRHDSHHDNPIALSRYSSIDDSPRELKHSMSGYPVEVEHVLVPDMIHALEDLLDDEKKTIRRSVSFRSRRSSSKNTSMRDLLSSSLFGASKSMKIFPDPVSDEVVFSHERVSVNDDIGVPSADHRYDKSETKVNEVNGDKLPVVSEQQHDDVTVGALPIPVMSDKQVDVVAVSEMPIQCENFTNATAPSLSSTICDIVTALCVVNIGQRRWSDAEMKSIETFLSMCESVLLSIKDSDTDISDIWHYDSDKCSQSDLFWAEQHVLKFDTVESQAAVAVVEALLNLQGDSNDPRVVCSVFCDVNDDTALDTYLWGLLCIANLVAIPVKVETEPVDHSAFLYPLDSVPHIHIDEDLDWDLPHSGPDDHFDLTSDAHHHSDESSLGVRSIHSHDADFDLGDVYDSNSECGDNQSVACAPQPLVQWNSPSSKSFSRK